MPTHPYQVVAFFGRRSKIGDLVYGEDTDSWLPQVAVKRRYALGEGISEQDMLRVVGEIAIKTAPFEVAFGKVTEPPHMRVEVIPVEPSAPLSRLHQAFFDSVGPSKFPDREGPNYFPHMTASSWAGHRVVEVAEYESKTYPISEIWIIQDGETETDTRVLKGFPLGQ